MTLKYDDPHAMGPNSYFFTYFFFEFFSDPSVKTYSYAVCDIRTLKKKKYLSIFRASLEFQANRGGRESEGNL